MTDIQREAEAISRAFKQAFGLPADQPLPVQPPTAITLTLRAEAYDTLIHLAEHYGVPKEQIAENILASRLKTKGRMQRRRHYVTDDPKVDGPHARPAPIRRPSDKSDSTC